MSTEDFLANLIKIRVNNAPPTPAEHYSVGTRRLGCDRNTYILEENKSNLFVNLQNI